MRRFTKRAKVLHGAGVTGDLNVTINVDLTDADSCAFEAINAPGTVNWCEATKFQIEKESTLEKVFDFIIGRIDGEINADGNEPSYTLELEGIRGLICNLLMGVKGKHIPRSLQKQIFNVLDMMFERQFILLSLLEEELAFSSTINVVTKTEHYERIRARRVALERVTQMFKHNRSILN